MITSAAWLDLSAGQKALYLACKMQLHRPHQHPNDGERDTFYLNKYQWAYTYQLYKDNNGGGFTSDIEELIQHGFISCVASGQSNRSKSVYRFSSMWQNYGKPSFKITEKDMTPAMVKKIKNGLRPGRKKKAIDISQPDRPQTIEKSKQCDRLTEQTY